ncbi:hypothetical protein Ocin01_18549 [Orchesella cincta]|uniref:Uncharacterized protein n=1 Tax=Orchesella cincta TaxID=48709 RepID=A0A1D2M594_ORCCI|nr:hypothetical protein Ocin01_18549 [Orchesella cincta]
MDIGVAVKLFVHTLKVEGNGQLKWKAIKVIKSKPNELMILLRLTNFGGMIRILRKRFFGLDDDGYWIRKRVQSSNFP